MTRSRHAVKIRPRGPRALACDAMERPRVPPLDELSQRVALRARWSDEDTQHVLNNAAYLTLLEEARYRWFGERGLLRGRAFPFVVAQTNARYLAPGRGGEDVTVAFATTHIGSSSFVQAYRVIDASGRELCEAEALLVGWGERGGKARLPGPLVAALREERR